MTHLTRPRTPEAEIADAKDAKRLKVSHPNGISITSIIPSSPDSPSAFYPGVLEYTNIARLAQAYKVNGPFHYALVEKLFQDDLLRKVKDECLSELSFTEKETDIYKVNQTGDLASLNFLTESQRALLPSLLELRNALYSPEFRSFLRTVTGTGPLSGTKQDMSVNTYTKGCHLLNHDDVIGTRRVSYILYMPIPTFQLWQKDWGGALELYPVKETAEGLEPEAIPSKSIPPSWNQFIFFEVQPGQSFHSVEEVAVGGADVEDGRERLSISGWFHAAQPGEEGYVPEEAQELKSSRDQLASTSTQFSSYPSETNGQEAAAPMPDQPLSEEHITFLSEYLNPVYLQPRTMKTLASRFVEESSLQLHSFLASDLAAALEPSLRELDAKDGLGPARNGKIPPHDSGICTHVASANTTAPNYEGVNTVTLTPAAEKDESRSVWTVKGPPHKWRYCTLLPPSPSAPATSITPLSAHPSPSEIMRALQDELLPSEAFRAWLANVSNLLPLRHNVEARRFRPGLDYTLATSEESEARLDVSLGLTPMVKEPEDDSDEQPEAAPDSKSSKKARKKAVAAAAAKREAEPGWAAAEWGGWECYMAPHDEEDDPAVYRSGANKKAAPEANGNGHVNGDDAAADEEMDEDDEEGDDSALLTVLPGFNRLLLVLRDERVMRFVKYVSAAAEGSRWDVCGEYEIGMVQADDEDDDEETSE